MSKTNCINCGAAKDTDEIRCPFCGTTYLDLTAIDFASGKPVVCQFVMPKYLQYANSKERVVMSMLAVPILDEISMTNDAIEYTSLHDSMRRYFPAQMNINVGISFKPITQSNGHIFDVRDAKKDETEW